VVNIVPPCAVGRVSLCMAGGFRDQLWWMLQLQSRYLVH